MWCKQLILVIIRALFDIVDINTKQLTTDTRIINGAFKHHLVKVRVLLEICMILRNFK